MSKAMWIVILVATLLLPYNLYAQCRCCSGKKAQQTQVQGQSPAVKTPAAPAKQGMDSPSSPESGLQAKEDEKQGVTKLARQGEDDPKKQSK